MWNHKTNQGNEPQVNCHSTWWVLMHKCIPTSDSQVVSGKWTPRSTVVFIFSFHFKYITPQARCFDSVNQFCSSLPQAELESNFAPIVCLSMLLGPLGNSLCESRKTAEFSWHWQLPKHNVVWRRDNLQLCLRGGVIKWSLWCKETTKQHNETVDSWRIGF